MNYYQTLAYMKFKSRSLDGVSRWPTTNWLYIAELRVCLPLRPPPPLATATTYHTTLCVVYSTLHVQTRTGLTTLALYDFGKIKLGNKYHIVKIKLIISSFIYILFVNCVSFRTLSWYVNKMVKCHSLTAPVGECHNSVSHIHLSVIVTMVLVC